jgi:DNA repair ATPase RecN
MDSVFPRYSMEKRLSNLAEQLQKQQDFEPLLQAVRELSTNIKENGNTQILSNLGKLTEAVSSGFTQTNNSLNKAIETLAKGATEQVIEALKQVITDFNSNLTEQFGENFKHLNQAVFKLVEWQENYKTTLEEVQNALNLSLDSIETTDATLKSIASRNADILKVHENLGALLSLLNNQSEEAQERLQDYNQLHKDSSALLVQIKQQLQSTETSVKNSFQKMTTDLDVVLSNSVDKLEKHNKATNDLVYNSFVETMQALDTISVKIQNALTKQSENMASLTETLPEHSRQLKNSSDEIQRQLEQSLSQMQTVLVGITNKFAEVYETSLKRPFVESQ